MRTTSLLLLAALSGISGAAEQLPTLPDTIHLREWLVCGPFSVGIREGITGVFDDPAQFRPREGDSFRSALVQSGQTICRKVEADSTGWVKTNYQEVHWDSIQDFYGTSGLMAAGYAYSEFYTPQRCRALAFGRKVASFCLNGLAYQGDAYGTGKYVQPVVLDSGVNRILVSLGGFGDQQFRFSLVPIPSSVVTLCKDATAPDALADSSLSAWLGIPVINTTTERLDSIHLALSFRGSTIAETTVHNLPGLGAKKVPVRVKLPALPAESTRTWFLCRAWVRADTFQDTLYLRVRNTAQARSETFISSMDGSCQYYGILYPRNYDPAKRYALILSLHGAGVEASGLADCFKPKDWAFVVCPTNRRPFGFNWQDWGRLDGLEVLDHALANLPIDPDRVLLTGHSMGGHGTWHLGLAHPDRFAAIAPEAGWPSIPLYVPWFLQRSVIFAEPDQLAIRDRVMVTDNTPAYLANAANLPAFILHGGEDDNVPAFHGRNFAVWLSELGYAYRYKEVPGRRHWWQYEAESLSVVDDADLMSFLEGKRRNPGPRHVLFRTADLGQSNRAYWLTLDRVRVVGRMAEVEAWAEDTLVRVNTRNVAQITLHLDQRLFFERTASVVVDGTNLGKVRALPALVTVSRQGNRWRMGPTRLPSLHKTPDLYGPARQALFRPFVLVYGTQDSVLKALLHHSATQEAMRWWQRGNGLAEVLPDTAITPAIAAKYNLVLYGNPYENLYVRRIARGLPVQVRGNRMFLNDTNLGTGLAALFVYPNPDNQDRLVLVRMGTNAENTKLSLFWAVMASEAGIPDFMIFDKSVRHWGWAGVKAAGFFDPFWQVSSSSLWLKE